MFCNVRCIKVVFIYATMFPYEKKNIFKSGLEGVVWDLTFEDFPHMSDSEKRVSISCSSYSICCSSVRLREECLHVL